jgi:hypothetical protein
MVAVLLHPNMFCIPAVSKMEAYPTPFANIILCICPQGTFLTHFLQLSSSKVFKIVIWSHSNLLIEHTVLNADLIQFAYTSLCSIVLVVWPSAWYLSDFPSAFAGVLSLIVCIHFPLFLVVTWWKYPEYFVVLKQLQVVAKAHWKVLTITSLGGVSTYTEPEAGVNTSSFALACLGVSVWWSVGGLLLAWCGESCRLLSSGCLLVVPRNNVLRK